MQEYIYESKENICIIFYIDWLIDWLIDLSIYLFILYSFLIYIFIYLVPNLFFIFKYSLVMKLLKTTWWNLDVPSIWWSKINFAIF